MLLIFFPFSAFHLKRVVQYPLAKINMRKVPYYMFLVVYMYHDYKFCNSGRRDVTEYLYSHESEKVNVLVTQSCLTLCNPTNCKPPGSSVHGILQTRIREWGHFILQEIFPTQGLNPGLLHCREILYCLSHEKRSYLHLLP